MASLFTTKGGLVGNFQLGSVVSRLFIFNIDILTDRDDDDYDYVECDSCTY